MSVSVFMISICCCLILLSLISCIMNPLFRIPKLTAEEAGENDKPLPPLSVIVMVNDDIDILERNMPLLVEQDYDPGYQVIIVANEGDSLADDLVKRYQDNKQIHSTFIPKTARYISKEKLGVTLGVKAAKYEWCILMDATSYPVSKNWLREMGRKCDDNHNLVLGYCNYDDDTKTFKRFARIRHFAYLWREAESGVVYAANNSNLAFRRSEFIANDGYRGNLECVRGEYDFIINKYARNGETAVVTSEEGSLTECTPTKKQWKRRRLFYIHSCRLMAHGGKHKGLAFSDSALLHLCWIANIAAIVYASFVQEWIMLGSAIVALLANIAWRTYSGTKATESLNTDIPHWAIVPLELTSVWHTLADRIRYRLASKYDFTCHKL